MTKEYNVNYTFEPEQFFMLAMKKAAEKEGGCKYGGGCYALYHQQECHDCLKTFKSGGEDVIRED
jgi:hypothetical protein